ncbi:MAG: hypothetical protein ACK46D_17465, partial [Roseiflexaceae bacterium]
TFIFVATIGSLLGRGANATHWHTLAYLKHAFPILPQPSGQGQTEFGTSPGTVRYNTANECNDTQHAGATHLRTMIEGAVRQPDA